MASRLWIKYPPLDAAVVDPGNPRRFLRSAEWKKVRDDFFHGQLEKLRAGDALRDAHAHGRVDREVGFANRRVRHKSRLPPTGTGAEGISTALESTSPMRNNSGVGSRARNAAPRKPSGLNLPITTRPDCTSAVGRSLVPGVLSSLFRADEVSRTAIGYSAGTSFAQAALSFAAGGISRRVPGASDTRRSSVRFQAKSAR